MEIDKQKVGSRIKGIRLDLGDTLEEFGDRFDTSKVTVFNWEKGRNLPNKNNLKSISELGNLTVQELLLGTKEDYVYNVLHNDLLSEGRFYENLKKRYSKSRGFNSEKDEKDILLEFWYNNSSSIIHQTVLNIMMMNANYNLSEITLEKDTSNQNAFKINISVENDSSKNYSLINNKDKTTNLRNFYDDKIVIDSAVIAIGHILKYDESFDEFFTRFSRKILEIGSYQTKKTVDEIKETLIKKGMDENRAETVAKDKFYISKLSDEIYKLEQKAEQIKSEYKNDI